MRMIKCCVLLFSFSLLSCASDIQGKETEQIIIETESSNITVYCPVKDDESHYVRIDVRHYENRAKNLDIWRLSKAFYEKKLSDDKFQNEYCQEFIYPGEWECAILTMKDSVRNKDFMGGFHGFEKLKSVSFMIDGKEVDMLTSGKHLIGNKLQMKESSVMFEYGSEKGVAIHDKLLTITSEGIFVDQAVEWTESLDVLNAYLTMLPIARSLKDSTQITDRLQMNNSEIIHDIRYSNKNQKVEGQYIKHVNIWGEESGINVDVDVKYEPLLPGNFFFCSMYTNQTGYNKLYFDFCRQYRAKKGEKWKSYTKFCFSKKQNNHE